MPPALSDYDSDSEPDTGLIAALQSKPPSRKRKQNGLLSGLDLNNIISIPSDEMITSTTGDSGPASSVPTSSYVTRGSANGGRTNDLAYDQKYHPMDDYLRPSQAAKRRAEHGLDDEDVDSAYSDNPAQSESDEPQTKKCKRLDKQSAPQGTRRSARQVNRDVLYNVNVHPQDEQLGEMNSDSMVEVSDEEEVVSTTSSAATEMVDLREIPDSDADASDLSNSSPLHSTPLSTISIGNSGQRIILSGDSRFSHTASSSPLVPRVERTPFVIYEESIQIQLAKRAMVPDSTHYEDDDKENHVEESAEAEDTSAEVDIRPIPVGTAARPEPEDTQYSQMLDFYNPPSMFVDGASDRVDDSNHMPSRPTTRARFRGFDEVSVIGHPSPCSSDFDSVLGPRSPIQSLM